MDRRMFCAALGAATIAATGAAGRQTGAARKKVLVLGGTNFVGPAVVDALVAGGHEVVLFNRGITRADDYPDLRKLRGTRAGAGASDLAALDTDERWDAVVDTWPEQSALVEETATLLRERTDYYFFVSSIAVYTDFSAPGLTEGAATWVDEPGWYGGEKAVAEQRLAELYPDRFGVARCHAILGPNDPGAGYHYWLQRLARGGDVLAPGDGSAPVQYVDVRDVGDWVADCVAAARPGVHNVCGPESTLTMRAFLERTAAGIGADANLVWADADFLRSEQGVASFSDMPYWTPTDEDAGFATISNAKAVAAGLTFRPVEVSARDAWRWHRSYFFKDRAFPHGGFGLAPEKEAEVLAAWAVRSG